MLRQWEGRKDLQTYIRRLFVKEGFVDPIAEDRNFLAEGLILKTPDELLSKNGKRLCFKIKTCDSQKVLQQIRYV